jgi:hypothetical protein
VCGCFGTQHAVLANCLRYVDTYIHACVHGCTPSRPCGSPWSHSRTTHHRRDAG